MERGLETIGGYTVERWLARGGTADVYAVSHPILDLPLALKLATTVHSQHARGRFARELQILGQVEHPAFARAYDLGRSDDGRDWLVLDRIEGLGPKDWANAIGRPGTRARTTRVARFGARVAEALLYLHDLGLVHGDVKPGNLRVQLGGGARLFDMGAALDLHAPTSWSQFGAGLGTGSYAAPEVIARDFERVGLRADIYALGVTLYELFSGTNPFRGTSDDETAARQRTHVAPRLDATLADFDKDLSDLLETMLAKRVADRTETMRSVAATLVRCAGPELPLPAPEPLLAPFGEALARVRGFLRDAPPGRGVLIEGPRRSGVDELMVRACDDAVRLGWTVAAYDRIGAAGVEALARGSEPTLVVATRLDSLTSDERERLEAALTEATQRGVVLGLIAGRESDALAPGPVNVSRKLALVRATMTVGPDDYVRATGDPARGRALWRAWGGRWLEGTQARAVAAADDRLLTLLTCAAWPLPRALLLALDERAPHEVTRALDALVRAGRVRVEPGGRVAAVGATIASIAGIPTPSGGRGDVDVNVDVDARGARGAGSDREVPSAHPGAVPQHPGASTHPHPLSVDHALALIDDLPTRVVWLVVCGRLDDARALLALEPADEALRAVVGSALGDGVHAHIASDDAARVATLRRAGRLSEARVLAERRLATSTDARERIALACLLADVARDLGAAALMDAWRAQAQRWVDAAGLTLPPDDTPLALDTMAQVEAIAALLDPADRVRLMLRPDVVRLRARHERGI